MRSVLGVVVFVQVEAVFAHLVLDFVQVAVVFAYLVPDSVQVVEEVVKQYLLLRFP